MDSSADAASAAMKELTALSEGADYAVADISNAADVEKAIQATVDRFGGISVLVNNAGIQTFGDPVTTTEEVWDRTDHWKGGLAEYENGKIHFPDLSCS